VLILPGGAYSHLATDHEGIQVAKWLNNLGVSAFMLEYRLGTKYHHPIELNDAKRGIRWVRSHAADYGYDPNRVGVWGFSAGGHLASTLGTHFDAGDPSAADPIDRLASRPDFMVLTYPVIGPLGPASVGSYDNLLGKNADLALITELTNDLHVTMQTPPTFLVAADDDAAVFPENSVNFYLALRKAKVPAELHIYKNGGHGFGLAPLDPVLSTWTTLLANWLRVNGYLATN
jgi:acetyl esterase/lipase